MGKPTIVFLIQHPNMPSSRARVLELLPFLYHHFDCTVISYPKGLLSKLKLIRNLEHFSIVFLQKKLPSLPEAFLLRLAAKKLVFDFDDAIMYRHDVHGGNLSRTRFLKFKTIVKLADFVIAGNRILMDYVKPINENVGVVPTGVPKDVPVKHHYNARLPRIGWIGGNINLPYLNEIIPVLEALNKKFPFELVIISGKTIGSKNLNVRFIPWEYKWQYRLLSKLDIGIMPLPDTKYAQGKCGYKALQYMTVGVPPVCSKVGSIEDIIRDGHDGILVRRFDGYQEALALLLADPETRRRIGTNARKRVLEAFTLEKVAELLMVYLKALL